MAQKILIVEDEHNIAQLLNLYLEKEGYEAQIAPDGGKAVELFRSFAPDLVLLDIMLPVMDGWAVLSRIRAVLRRTGAGGAQGGKRLSFDKLVINLDAYELLVDGKRIDTPPKELELLYHLASAPNRVFTRNQLLDEVWGFDYFGDSRTVDVHIKRLREKLEGISSQWNLKTVWGVGYKFEVTGS